MRSKRLEAFVPRRPDHPARRQNPKLARDLPHRRLPQTRPAARLPDLPDQYHLLAPGRSQNPRASAAVGLQGRPQPQLGSGTAEHLHRASAVGGERRKQSQVAVQPAAGEVIRTELTAAPTETDN